MFLSLAQSSSESKNLTWTGAILKDVTDLTETTLSSDAHYFRLARFHPGKKRPVFIVHFDTSYCKRCLLDCRTWPHLVAGHIAQALCFCIGGCIRVMCSHGYSAQNINLQKEALTVFAQLNQVLESARE